MRIAILSDIHGNLEALKEVLADLDTSEVDEIVCLGDMIGYGPAPEEVVALVRRRTMSTLQGNHELALVSPRYCGRLNASTRQSLELTKGFLSAASMAFLAALPRVLVRRGGRLVHGCPPASVTRYLYEPSPLRLAEVFTSFSEEVCFFGHTHIPALFSWDGAKAASLAMVEGVFAMQAGARYLVNVGSVGQPRDRLSNRAKYVIWDKAAATLELRCVSYNIAATVEMILAIGMPEHNATRLW